MQFGQDVPSVEAAEFVPRRGLEGSRQRGDVQCELVLQYVNLREHVGFDEQPTKVTRRRSLREEIKSRVVNIECAGSHALQRRCDVWTAKPADHGAGVYRSIREVRTKSSQLHRGRLIGTDEVIDPHLQAAPSAVGPGQELLTAARAAREPRWALDP